MIDLSDNGNGVFNMHSKLTIVLSVFLLVTGNSIAAHEPLETLEHKHHSNRISKACTVIAASCGVSTLLCAGGVIHALWTLVPFESPDGVDVWGKRTLVCAATTTLWLLAARYTRNNQEIQQPTKKPCKQR